MKSILSSLFGRACALADVEPLIALFLGAGLLAVFLMALRPIRPAANSAIEKPSLLWTLYGNASRLIGALLLVAFLAGSVTVLRIYLRRTVADFQRAHGRVTAANYNAVQTIWGAEQVQGELHIDIFDLEEVIERFESEDLTKPAVLRKKTVKRTATGNPFVSARHDVLLTINPRRKGSALYGGYETDCRFTWQLQNPDDTNHHCVFTFPLPAQGAMYDGMIAGLNGEDVLPQMQIRDGALVLARDMQPLEQMRFDLAFRSRGVAHWYFQVRESREIRDFELMLRLPDLPAEKLNYPEGCMTPTTLTPSANGRGTALTFRLDHALSNKGMGIALPALPQPGAMTNVVLNEIERAWLLLFAMLALAFTLAGVRQAVALTVLFGAASAFIYGLLGDLSDVLFGFWPTLALVLVPMLLGLATLARHALPGRPGTVLAGLFALIGIVYPCLAGLDGARQTLYLNLMALLLLAFTTWLLLPKLRSEATPVDGPSIVPETAGI